MTGFVVAGSTCDEQGCDDEWDPDKRGCNYHDQGFGFDDWITKDALGGRRRSASRWRFGIQLKLQCWKQ